MQECIKIFTQVLDDKCTSEGGKAVVDINRMLGNLTSVCLVLFLTPRNQSTKTESVIVRNHADE